MIKRPSSWTLFTTKDGADPAFFNIVHYNLFFTPRCTHHELNVMEIKLSISFKHFSEGS